MAQVWTKTGRLRVLTTLGADTTTLDGALCKLFTNDVTPTVDSDTTTFTGLGLDVVASDTITFSGPYLDVSGVPTLIADNILFVSGASADTVCFGMYMTDSAGAVVLSAERFAAPVGVVGVTFINVDPTVLLGNLE